MKTQDEIKLFRRVKALLIRGYGKTPYAHKGGIVLDCAECRANIGVDILDWHIDLLTWEEKQKLKSKTK